MVNGGRNKAMVSVRRAAVLRVRYGVYPLHNYRDGHVANTMDYLLVDKDRTTVAGTALP